MNALRRWRLARRRGVRLGASVVVARGVRAEVGTGGEIIIGDGCRIGPRTRLVAAPGGRLEIGEGATLGERCRLVAHDGGVTVGARAVLEDEVVLLDVEQPGDEVETPLRHQPLRTAPVTIGEDSRLAFGAKVLAGVTVGPRATVGASAVVSRDVPAGGTAGALPGSGGRRRDRSAG